MKRKKGLFLIFSLMLVLGLFAGCSNGKNAAKTDAKKGPSDSLNATGYPIVKKPITLKMMGMSSVKQAKWKDMLFFKYMKKKTNIHFEFRTIQTPEEYDKKKSLTFASGDLPDVFFGGRLNLQDQVKYGSDGTLIPLEGLIDKYAPNFEKILKNNPDIKRAITAPDGHIYALPLITDRPRNLVPKFWINHRWLKALGIKLLPHTTQELTQLLEKFKNGDPNGNGKHDEIPLSGFDLNAFWNSPILSAFGLVMDGNGLAVKNGKVIYGPITDQFKNYLTYMHMLYSKGLLDPQIVSHSRQQYIADGIGNKIGIGGHAAPILLFGFKNIDDSYQYPLLPVLTTPTNSKKMISENYGLNQGAFAITKKDKYPAATIRWVDYLYSDAGTMLSQVGVKGKSWTWNQDHTVWHMTPPKGMTRNQYRPKVTPAAGSATPYYRRKSIVDKITAKGMDNDYIEKATTDQYLPYGVKQFPPVMLTHDENQQVSTILDNTNSYLAQMQANFITGKKPLSDWDKYVKTLKSMQVDQMLKIYQKEYDRWNKIK